MNHSISISAMLRCLLHWQPNSRDELGDEASPPYVINRARIERAILDQQRLPFGWKQHIGDFQRHKCRTSEGLEDVGKGLDNEERLLACRIPLSVRIHVECTDILI